MSPNENSKESSPILVKLAHASAPFLSTFLLIHLSAPVLASVGGSDLSSKVLIFGREYYQTSFGEKYLLLAPFAIHVASGVVRRFFTPPSKHPRKLNSTLSLTAYATLIFFPIHVFTHRFTPTDASPPILSVGPAELDYEFVKTGLSRFPWRSWALYTGLVASVVMHAVEGANILRTTYLVAFPVVLGLWTLSKEPLMGLSSTVERYIACFTASWVYRM